ncbi:hypothetical protein [Algoriphagus winogradskyi]|uniref:Uncharacterized protein n=1 Tax=Algoriphagus winogradskyi TaxID=237017 RepID=A0ABY1PBM0_9BACT|nr:hypothetical protein [Algoriphagus winogradskyi]SMP30069.1 hypothetical protein SAMN06265367_106246 [Algoriphagus winogradskyi]
MKIIGVFIVLSCLVGCDQSPSSNNNSHHVYEFVNWLFAYENILNDSLILLQSEANSTWAVEYLENSSDIEDLTELKGLSSKNLNSFLSSTEWETILIQSTDRFVFDSAMLDSHIHLINQKEIENILSTHPEKFEQSGLFDLSNMYRSYQIISKPIFFKNGKFVVIYIETGTLDLMDGSRGLAFYERVLEGWEKISVVSLEKM